MRHTEAPQNKQSSLDRVAQNGCWLLLPPQLRRKVSTVAQKRREAAETNTCTLKKRPKPFSGNRICESRERFQLQTKPCLFYFVGYFIAISV